MQVSIVTDFDPRQWKARVQCVKFKAIALGFIFLLRKLRRLDPIHNLYSELKERVVISFIRCFWGDDMINTRLRKKIDLR